MLGVRDPSDFYVAEQNRVNHILNKLTQLTNEVRKVLPHGIFEERILSGHAKEELLKHAEHWPADLVVVGSHQQKFIDFVLLGGVSQLLLEHAPCPVHIARSPERNRDMTEPQNILVPLDYSSHAYATIDWILRQNFRRPCRVRLFTVLPRHEGDFAREKDPELANDMFTRIQETRVNAITRLEQFAEKMEQQLGKGAVDCDVQEGSPKDEILKAAKSWGANLIVIGSHGRTGLSRFLLGSVSKEVATHAKCSVEVVRPYQLEVPPEPEPEEEDKVRRPEEPDRIPHVIPH
jgi:nucleotide-binding universal stress UspA family protein